MNEDNNDGSVKVVDFTKNWNDSDNPRDFDFDDPEKDQVQKDKERQTPRKPKSNNVFGDTFRMDMYQNYTENENTYYQDPIKQKQKTEKEKQYLDHMMEEDAKDQAFVDRMLKLRRKQRIKEKEE